MSKKEVIINKALEILSLPESKNGIRVSSLIKRTSVETGENLNTCSGNLYDLQRQLPDKVLKPHKGLFILKENEKLLDMADKLEAKAEANFAEVHIYKPAKDHLLSIGECTHAIELGGNAFGKTWGTPDILGVIRANSDAIYNPTIEIVAVEVKNEQYSPEEALGQAMAYKLFAHRTWLVLPEDNDLERIEGISLSANIGLISFTRNNNEYIFSLRNRPISGRPDLTEVNEMIEKLKKDKKKYYDLIKNDRPE